MRSPTLLALWIYIEPPCRPVQTDGFLALERGEWRALARALQESGDASFRAAANTPLTVYVYQSAALVNGSPSTWRCATGVVCAHVGERRRRLEDCDLPSQCHR